VLVLGIFGNIGISERCDQVPKRWMFDKSEKVWITPIYVSETPSVSGVIETQLVKVCEDCS
jgi:hypothetical protein